MKRVKKLFSASKTWAKKHPVWVASIAAVLILLIVSGVYAWQSMSFWRALPGRADERVTEVKTQAAKLSEEDLNETQVRAAIDEITKAGGIFWENDRGESGSVFCDVPRLLQWQARAFGAARLALDECWERQNTLAGVGGAARELTNRLESEAQLAKVFSRLQENLAEAEEYQARKEAWDGFGKTFAELTLHESLTPAEEVIQSAFDDMIAGYDALLAANENEDRAAFDAAATQIEEAHTALHSIEASLEESFAPLIATFVEEAEKL